jgi:hypothetical protein
MLEELVLAYEFVIKYVATATLSGDHIFNLGKIKGSGTVSTVLNTKQYSIHHVTEADSVDSVVRGSSFNSVCG